MPKKEGIRKLFNNIAPSYDKLNHIMSLNIDHSWRRKAVKEIVKSEQPLHILDVASGTGDFAIAIAKKAPAGTSIIGADISEHMLEIGREKAAKAGFSQQITMEIGDCEALQYADGSFDAITVAFGVRNFEHLEIGLKEMCRVVKKGGRLVVLELSIPKNPIVAWAYKLYFLKITPKIGGWISGNRGAYEYLPSSVLRFPAPEKFSQMMRDAGFEDVKAKSLTLGICHMYVGTK